MTSLLEKVAAAQATLADFNGRPLAWGTCDCAVLIVSHLTRFGRVIDLSPGGQYRTANGAVRAVRRAGYRDLGEAVDAQGLEQIAPAQAMASDILGWTTENRSTLALSIALGNGRILGFHNETLICCVQAAEFDRPGLTCLAWRV
jgi:hypothetical protein